MRKEKSNTDELLTILVDLVSIILSFIISAFVRGGIINNGILLDIYQNILVVVILATIMIDSLTDNKDICKRGFLVEFICIVKDQGSYA